MISISDILGCPYIPCSTGSTLFECCPDSFKKELAEEPWPPRQWEEGDLKDSIQCSQHGLLQPYMAMEASLGKYEDRLSVMSSDEYMECVNFFRLLRESRGYDIQSFPSCIEEWVTHTLAPIPLDLVRGSCRPVFHEDTACALKTINAEAVWHGEAYEFGEYVNVVKSNFRPVTLLTFTVKRVGDGEVETAQAMLCRDCGYSRLSVEEWRFKPK